MGYTVNKLSCRKSFHSTSKENCIQQYTQNAFNIFKAKLDALLGKAQTIQPLNDAIQP